MPCQVTQVFQLQLLVKICIKIIEGQQAKIYKNYKNIRLKLLKTNAAIWFHKMCKILPTAAFEIPV